MSSFALNAPRRLCVGLLTVLLAVGVLVSAPSAQAATTLTYEGSELILQDWDAYLAFDVVGADAAGTMTATVAGKTLTLAPATGANQEARHEVWIDGGLPVGVHPVKATFTPAGGGAAVTGSGVLEVDGPLLYPTSIPPRGSDTARQSGFKWQVSPQLRALVTSEGGRVTYGAGAEPDTEDSAYVRFPVVDLTHSAPLHRQAFAGTVRFASAKRDVTVSDIRQVETKRSDSGSTYVLQADVTYRHPGVAKRTQRGLTVANLVDGIGGAGDPWWASATTWKATATSAGAKALASSEGASLGTAQWETYFTDSAPRITTKVSLSPRSRTYGKTSRVNVSVSRQGTYATGKVTVKAGSRSLGTVRLSQGKGSVSVPASLAAGSYQVTAAYRADYSPAKASARATLKVSKAKTATKVKLAKKSVKRKQRAKVSVRVRGKGTSLQPRGKVTVFDGKKRLKRAKTNAKGKVTVKLPKLKKGKHKLRIVFAGGKSFASSTGRVTLRVR